MKGKRGVALLTICMTGLTCLIRAQGMPDPARADSLFRAGQYTEAISIWKGLTMSSPQAALYYNIGLAHSHLRQTAEAIYAFEQAMRLDHANSRIKAELERERSLVQDAVIALEPFILSRWGVNIINVFRPGVWAIAGLMILLFVTVHAMAAKKILPIRHLDVGNRYLWGIIPGFLMLILAFLAYQHLHRSDEGIIMQSCACRQAPAAESPAVRMLSPGEKVQFKDQIGEWNQVVLANLDEGWIKGECATVIRIP